MYSSLYMIRTPTISFFRFLFLCRNSILMYVYKNLHFKLLKLSPNICDFQDKRILRIQDKQIEYFI